MYMLLIYSRLSNICTYISINMPVKTIDLIKVIDINRLDGA